MLRSAIATATIPIVGRSSYSQAEIEEIKHLLREVRRSDSSAQKRLRGRLRRQFDFYITDYATDGQGFVASDVDQLVRRGVIAVIPGSDGRRPPHQRPDPSRREPLVEPPLSQDKPVDAPVPATFQRAGLEAVGFVGWRSWRDLRATSLREVPAEAGCYVVYRGSSDSPAFLEANPGGRFKGRDPTVPIDLLEAKWLAGANTVYVGKAGSLRSRLRQYARFGAGDPVGHWGGRYVWQLADSGELLVAWRRVDGAEPARIYEKRLLERFASLHEQRRPFANLVG